MKSALRFLQRMPGFVPMNIKDCLLRLLFLFGWCGFSWEEDKERNGRIILQRQPLQGQNPFFIEFIACCRAYNVIMFSNKGSLCSISSAYPCRSDFEPDYSVNHVRGKRYQELLKGWPQPGKHLPPHSQRLNFFSWKWNLRIQVNIKRRDCFLPHLRQWVTQLTHYTWSPILL